MRHSGGRGHQTHRRGGIHQAGLVRVPQRAAHSRALEEPVERLSVRGRVPHVRDAGGWEKTPAVVRVQDARAARVHERVRVHDAPLRVPVHDRRHRLVLVVDLVEDAHVHRVLREQVDDARGVLLAHAVRAVRDLLVHSAVVVHLHYDGERDRWNELDPHAARPVAEEPDAHLRVVLVREPRDVREPHPLRRRLTAHANAVLREEGLQVVARGVVVREHRRLLVVLLPQLRGVVPNPILARR